VPSVRGRPWSGRQTHATLGTPTVDEGAAGAGSHPRAEAQSPLPAPVARLIGSLHGRGRAVYGRSKATVNPLFAAPSRTRLDNHRTTSEGSLERREPPESATDLRVSPGPSPGVDKRRADLPLLSPPRGLPILRDPSGPGHAPSPPQRRSITPSHLHRLWTHAVENP
jgi:hypothetical protein